MSLTKMHFEELAKIFRDYTTKFPLVRQDQEAIDALFWALADFGARHNPYFDLNRFREACYGP